VGLELTTKGKTLAENYATTGKYLFQEKPRERRGKALILEKMLAKRRGGTKE